MGLFAGQGKGRASPIFIYYTFNFSVRSALLEEFCFMMAFQILKLRMGGPILPLILHAFEASIQKILPRFFRISYISTLNSRRMIYCVTFRKNDEKPRLI
jgi:hypothetical protein